jgi:hypothetical protein
LLLRAFLFEAGVDLVLHAVAASGRLVHEALCVAFFEGGNDIGTCWDTGSVLVQIGTSTGRITHGILGVKMRMHNCDSLKLSASRLSCCAVGCSGVVRVRSRWNDGWLNHGVLGRTLQKALAKRPAPVVG